MEIKHCLECGSPLKGRRDKKYCDDACRNAQYNRVHNEEVLLMRNIHNVLRKNRRILEQLLPAGQLRHKVNLTQLTAEGFSFKYHTHIEFDRAGNEIFYCYEIGYQRLNDQKLLIRLQQQQQAA